MILYNSHAVQLKTFGAWEHFEWFICLVVTPQSQYTTTTFQFLCIVHGYPATHSGRFLNQQITHQLHDSEVFRCLSYVELAGCCAAMIGT